MAQNNQPLTIEITQNNNHMKHFISLSLAIIALLFAGCKENNPDEPESTNTTTTNTTTPPSVTPPASLVDGELAGDFSVSATKKVHFSKGNLQAAYDGSQWTWGFAANQWDYVGNATANTSITGNGTVSVNDTVDLFGWSTPATYYGIHKNASSASYSGNFVDWGATIGEGWRTLARDEWVYLIWTRTGDKASTVAGTADACYIKATVNNVCGVILFPNGGIFAAGEFSAIASPNTSDAAYATTTCTADQWKALEAKGCVFLPAAGNRIGTDVYAAGVNGDYWSSTKDDDTFVCNMYFQSGKVYPDGGSGRFKGQSVRLVR